MKTRTSALRWAGMAIILASMMWGAAAKADPRCWGEDGVAVRPLQDVYTETATARSADGRTLFVWSDARAGSYDVYAQLYDTDGEELWGTGIPVVQHEASQILPAACAVDGGWVVAWIDMRDNTYPWDGEEGYTGGNIRAQKLANSGGHLWGDSGVPVYSMTTEPDVIQIVAADDGAGGAIFAWRNDYPNDLVAQRVSASGAVQWADPLSLTDANTYRYELLACGDGAGNMLAGWREYAGGEFAFHVAKITPASELPWGINGHAVHGNFHTSYSSVICPDGANGCFIAWVDERTGAADLYAQRVNGDGIAQWPDSGVAVCTAHSASVNLAAAASRMAGQVDGLLVAWEDYRVNSYRSEIYAQKVLLSGTIAWSADGRKVFGDATIEDGTICSLPFVASDGQGGLVCAWNDTRNDPGGSNPSVYMNRVLADSTLAWQGETGIRISQSIGSGSSNTVWANPASATCLFYTTGNDADYGFRRQKVNLTDGARLLSPEGAPVASGMRDGLGYGDPVAVTMAGGRTALFWSDQRSMLGNRVYMQIMDTAGHFERGALGTQLLPNDGGGIYSQFTQQGPRVCRDGSGGFFAVVSDSRTGSWQLRAVHINTQGNLASDSSGRVLEVDAYDQKYARCVPDGSGGCYVAWACFNAAWYFQTKLTHLNSLCQATWTTPLIITTGNENDYTPFALVLNPDGGCTLLSGEGYTDNPVRLFVTRVNSGGTVVWQRILESTDHFHSAAMVDDRAGGIYLLSDVFNTSNMRRSLIARHFDDNGDDTWGTGLTIAADSAVDYGPPQISMDAQRNLYVLYISGYDGYQVYAHKLAPSGSRFWGEHGLLLAAGADLNDLTFCPDGNGGLVAGWVEGDQVTWQMRLMGKHVNANGQPADPYWEGDTGGEIFPLQYIHNNPVITADGVGGFVVTSASRFAEEATGAQVLLAQRLSGGPLAAHENPPAPRAFALRQNYPNPFNPATEISFDLPRSERVKLSVFDVLGRYVQTLADDHFVAGLHRIRFDGSALVSGIYFYRLEAGSFRAVKKMVMVK